MIYLFSAILWIFVIALFTIIPINILVRLKNSHMYKIHFWRIYAGAVIFWLMSSIGAGLISRSASSSGVDDGFVILVMLGFAIYAAYSNKYWTFKQKELFVLGIWFIHAFTSSILVLCGFGYFVSPHLIWRGASLTTALPLVVWSMCRSKYFVDFIDINKTADI